MNFETISSSMNILFDRFFQPGQAEVIVLGLCLWLTLRRLLPTGSHYVLKQTITFFFLCVMGELGAALLQAFGWPMAASGLYEVTLLGVGIALIRFVGLLLFRVVMPAQVI